VDLWVIALTRALDRPLRTFAADDQGVSTCSAAEFDFAGGSVIRHEAPSRLRGL